MRENRDVVILQEDRFDATESVTVCGLTTAHDEAPLPRPAIESTPANGLKSPSWLMVDKITTVPRKRLGRRVGVLDAADVVRLNRAIAVFLGLASMHSS